MIALAVLAGVVLAAMAAVGLIVALVEAPAPRHRLDDDLRMRAGRMAGTSR